MGSDPGNELQVVHPLLLFAAFSISVADLQGLSWRRQKSREFLRGRSKNWEKKTR
jgi:hypothetical protein